MKKKKNIMMKEATNVAKLGMVSMAGMGAMGAMRNIPGMPSQAGNIVGITGSGLALVNVGQMLKSGKKIAKSFKY